MFLAKRI